MKNIDERRYSDPWYRGLGKNARLMLDYLICKSDCGGFTVFDEEVCEFESLLEEEESEAALRELSKERKGVGRVFVRENENSNEKVIWLKNYVKIQCGGKELSYGSNFHKGVIKRFEEMTGLFPEVKESYTTKEGRPKPILSQVDLTKGNIPQVDLTYPNLPLVNPAYPSLGQANLAYAPRREEKRREESYSGKGEEGMQGGKRGFQVDRTAAYGKKAIRLYETMENEGVTLVSNLKFEVFGKMVRDNPATRWFDLIDNLVTADLNSADGIKSPLGYMAKLTRGADFILAVGDKDAPKAKPGGKKSAESERSKIETYRSDAIDKLRHARDAGELTAEEFLKKRDAAWDKGVALLAELAEKEKPQNRRG